MPLHRKCTQELCISRFYSAAVLFHLVGSTDLGRRFHHLSHPLVLQHGPQSHSPTTFGTSLLTLPTWPAAFPARASSSTERPPTSFPRLPAPSFATWALAYGTFMPLHPTLGSMPGLAKTIFPCNTFAPYPGPGSQTKASAPEPSANFHHISGHPPDSRSPTASGGPGTATPQPPMTLPVPEDWLQDSDYLDTRRSIGNLSCPRRRVLLLGTREGNRWYSRHEPASCSFPIPGMEQLLASMDRQREKGLLCSGPRQG